MNKREELIRDEEEFHEEMNRISHSMMYLIEQQESLAERQRELLTEYARYRDYRDHIREQLDGKRSLDDPYIPF